MNVDRFAGRLRTLRSRLAGLCRRARVARHITAQKPPETSRDATLRALEESEERYRHLFENAPVGIYRTTPDGRILLANPALVRMLGYASFEELAAHDLEKEGPHATYARGWFKEALEREGEIRGLEATWRRRDNTMLFVRESARVVCGEDGAACYYEGTVEDVTERKRMEHVSRGQMAALTCMLNALTARPELDTFLGQVLTAIAEQLGSQHTSLWFYNAEQNSLLLHMIYDKGQILSQEQARPAAGATPVPPREAPLWQEVVRTRQPLLIENIARDGRVRDREWLLSQGVQTLLLVPLLLGDEVIGWLSVCSADARRYRPEEIELAQALAQQATLAVQLTRLAGQEQQAAVLAERNRMAREIHDTLAQGFTGIMIQLEVAEDALPGEPGQAQVHIARARDLARASLAEARRSVWALHPQALEEGRLPAVLADLAGQMTFGTPVRAEFHVRGTPRALPPDVESNLLRIGLEALTNTLKHARARALHLELSFEPERVRLSVRDDGQGFEPPLPAGRGGFGLTGMRERAEGMGGQLTVASQPGRGTEVAVTVPAAYRNDCGSPHV